MEKVITCPCGFALRGQSDDEVVKKAQEHAKSVHGMELSREQALEILDKVRDQRALAKAAKRPKN